MKWPVRGAFGALFLIASLLAAGCGTADTAVSGKLLENGEPIKPPENLPPGDKGLRMSFAAEGATPEKAMDTKWAIIDSNGSFHVEKGLPAGKYKITVFKGAMGAPKSTTVQIADVIEIPKAKAVTVEVDAGKKTAKVNP